MPWLGRVPAARIGRARTYRPGRQVPAWPRRSGRGRDARTGRRYHGAGRALGWYRVRRPRRRAHRTSGGRTDAPRTSEALTSAYPTCVSRTNADRVSGYLRSVARTNAGRLDVRRPGWCRGIWRWWLPANRAHPPGGRRPLTPGRRRGIRSFSGHGGHHCRRPSAEAGMPAEGRRRGRGVPSAAGCPGALRPHRARALPGPRRSRSPGEIQPDASCLRPGPGPPAGFPGWRRSYGRPGRIPGAGPGLYLRTCPARRQCDGPSQRGGPARRLRGGPDYLRRSRRGWTRLNFPWSAPRVASSGSRRWGHGPWVSRIPQPRLPTSSFHTT